MPENFPENPVVENVAHEERENLDLPASPVIQTSLDLARLNIPEEERQEFETEYFRAETEEGKEKVVRSAFLKRTAYALATFAALFGTEISRPELLEAQSQTVAILEQKKLSPLKESDDSATELLKTLESVKLPEKISQLKEQFGSDHFTWFLKEARFYLEIINIIRTQDVADEKKGLESLQNILRNNAGMFFDLETLLQNQTDRLVREGNPDAMVMGFELIPGFSNDSIKNLLEENIGEDYVYGNLGLIRYINYGESRTTYSVAGRMRGQGRRSLFARDTMQAILMYRHNWGNAEAPGPEYLIKFFAHEIAHSIDWDESPVLTIPERVDFLMEVKSRLDSPDRFKKYYIEDAIPEEYSLNNWSKTLMLWRQSVEYWAVLTEEYISNPRYLEMKYPADYKLVDKWYRLQGERLAQIRSQADSQIATATETK